MRQLGEAVLKKFIKSKPGFRMVVVSQWLSTCGFSLAALLLGKEKIFVPPSKVVKKLFLAQECKVSSRDGCV